MKNRTFLEVSLVGITIGLGVLMHAVGQYHSVVLYLFFLPVALGGFFIGTYRAGVLAFLSFVVALVAVGTNVPEADASPLVTSLGIFLWGSVLGLVAILVGSLNDRFRESMTNLHDAYVGVVEVLSRYLQGGDANRADRSARLADLCVRVATELGLPPKEVDDVRVAALLSDLNHIEVTTRVVERALAALDVEPEDAEPSTFQGTDFVESLRDVLTSAVSLLEPDTEADDHDDKPAGSRIITAVRAYCELTRSPAADETRRTDALVRLQTNETWYGRDVLRALSRVVSAGDPRPTKRDHHVDDLLLQFR